ncbi:MAG: FAD-dependent oxidoreductase [Alphaproteobacteria bacterium]|nr:FAD-dependent oxidoreductase [Alphaproteobacteria bacterium]
MTLHVIGAGMAGLAAAVLAAGRGVPVVMYESSVRAGGRCRSFFDPTLGCVIDNGTHLILGANKGVFAYLKSIGASGSLTPAPAAFPFIDLPSGARWTVRPGSLASLNGTGARWQDLGGLFRLWRAAPEATVATCFNNASTLYDRFWHPLTLAALNTPPEAAAARLLWRVTTEALLRGPAAGRPFLAPNGLEAALVTPAMTYLAGHGAEIRFSALLRGFNYDGEGRVAALRFAGSTVTVPMGDKVVLAVPPWSAATILPGLTTPKDVRSIVGAHYRLTPPPDLPGGMLGVTGGTAQWLFTRGDILSITVSAADELGALPAPRIAAQLWADAACALGRSREPLPPYRVIKERRATIAHTPFELARRPHAGDAKAPNLWLAGDWTATGLPCTIDGAIRSGTTAAELALATPARF